MAELDPGLAHYLGAIPTTRPVRRAPISLPGEQSLTLEELALKEQALREKFDSLLQKYDHELQHKLKLDDSVSKLRNSYELRKKRILNERSKKKEQSIPLLVAHSATPALLSIPLSSSALSSVASTIGTSDSVGVTTTAAASSSSSSSSSSKRSRKKKASSSPSTSSFPFSAAATQGQSTLESGEDSSMSMMCDESIILEGDDTELMMGSVVVNNLVDCDPAPEPYPSDSDVQMNLIRAQMEYYFSDYNLKRDKRLLQQIKKSPINGCLPMSEVLKFTKIKQVCSRAEDLKKALEHSELVHIRPPPPLLEKQQSKSQSPSAMTEDYHSLSSTMHCSSMRKRKSGHKSRPESTIIPIPKLTPSLGFVSGGIGGHSVKLGQSHSSSSMLQSLMRSYVGRPSFIPPKEKPFPFRRTVFVYGIDTDTTEEDIIGMMRPFGSVERDRVTMDGGIHTPDRDIQRRLLTKEYRVYDLYTDPHPKCKHRVQMYISCNQTDTRVLTPIDPDGGSEESSSIKGDNSSNSTKNKSSKNLSNDTGESDSLNKDEYHCQLCGKKKACKDYFYFSRGVDSDNLVLWCLQCSAKKAEEQRNLFQHRIEQKRNKYGMNEERLNRYIRRKRGKYLGVSSSDIDECRTALVVFQSQRQASKCVFVRSRLAGERLGDRLVCEDFLAKRQMFVTHYHHYNKMLKERMDQRVPLQVNVEDHP